MTLLSRGKALFSRISLSYTKYLLCLLRSPRNAREWRDRLLFNIIKMVIPLGIILVLISSCVELSGGKTLPVLLNLCSILSILIAALMPGISPGTRRISIAVALLLAGIAQLVLLRYFMIGYLHLMAFSVFIAVQFPLKRIYFAVLINMLMIAAILTLINSGILKGPAGVSLGQLLINSINFIFINMVVVVQVGEALRHLMKSMKREERLQGSLRNRLKLISQLHERQVTSEQYYKSLFVKSPSPLIIYDPETLKILQTNAAAVERYGIQEKDFLRKKVSELKFFNDKGELMVNEPLLQKNMRGEEFFVELKCDDLLIYGAEVKLIVINDVTAIMNYSRTVKKQNETLRSIAFSQSHNIRAPLANILGLIPLLERAQTDSEREELLLLLDSAASELDTVVQKIVLRAS